MTEHIHKPVTGWQIGLSYLFTVFCLSIIVIGNGARVSQSTTSSIEELTRELRGFNQDVCIAINQMHIQSGVGEVVDCAWSEAEGLWLGRFLVPRGVVDGLVAYYGRN